MKLLIEEKRVNRLRLLFETYKASSTNSVNLALNAMHFCLKNGKFKDAYQYLQGELLLDGNDNGNKDKLPIAISTLQNSNTISNT